MKIDLPIRWQPSPILIKEMRSTMRGGRTFIGITLFLLFLAVITLLVYFAMTESGLGTNAAEAGRTIFGFVAVIEALMLAVIAPPLTSGAIASERQKQTFEMLMASPLSTGQVLRGKLIAALNYLLLLLFAGLPINSIVFVFGGIPPESLLWWVGLVLVVLLLLGTLGLFLSTVFRSSGAATAIAYLISAFVFVMAPIMIVMMLGLLTGFGGESECIAAGLFLLHPAGALFAILLGEIDLVGPSNLLPAFLLLYLALSTLLYLGAEARLNRLVARRWRGWPFVPVALLVALLATAYILAVPVQELCN